MTKNTTFGKSRLKILQFFFSETTVSVGHNHSFHHLHLFFWPFFDLSLCFENQFCFGHSDFVNCMQFCTCPSTARDPQVGKHTQSTRHSLIKTNNGVQNSNLQSKVTYKHIFWTSSPNHTVERLIRILSLSMLTTAQQSWIWQIPEDWFYLLHYCNRERSLVAVGFPTFYTFIELESWATSM